MTAAPGARIPGSRGAAAFLSAFSRATQGSLGVGHHREHHNGGDKGSLQDRFLHHGLLIAESARGGRDRMTT